MRRLIVVMLLCGSSMVSAKPLDPTFGTGQGFVTAGFDLGGDLSDFANTVIEDNDGRLLQVGDVATGMGPRCIGLMRFSADGAPDPSFGVDGKVCRSGVLESTGGYGPMPIVVQEDGRILIAGGIYDADDVPRIYLCRFLSSGDSDPAFGDGKIPGCQIYTQYQSYAGFGLSLVVDGNVAFVISARYVLEPSYHNVPTLARIDLDDGHLIPFGNEPAVDVMPAGGATTAILADATMTPDGYLVMTGHGFYPSDKKTETVVMRVDPANGTPVTSFNGTGTVRISLSDKASYEDAGWAVHSMPDGTVLVAGHVQLDGGPPFHAMAFVRLDADTGLPDPTFNGGKPKTYSPCKKVAGDCRFYPSSLAVSSTGDMAIAGQGEVDNQGDLFVARVRPDGTGDPTLGVDGLMRLDFGTSFNEQANSVLFQGQKIVVGAYVTKNANTDFALLRFVDGDIFHDGFDIAP